MVADDFGGRGEPITRAEARRRARLRGKKQELKQRVVDQTAGLDNPRNVRVRRDGNKLVASLTSAGQENVRDYQVEQQRDARAREQRLPEKLGLDSSSGDVTDQAADIDAELTKDASGDISTAQREKARRDIADKADVDPDRVKIVGQTDDGGFRARIEKQPEREEQFGDIDWSFGFGDPDKDEVEGGLRSAAAEVDKATGKVVEINDKYGPPAAIGATYDAVREYVSEPVDDVVAGPDGETFGEEFASGAVEGAVQLANVPQTAVGLMEIGETGQYIVTGDEGTDGVVDLSTDSSAAVMGAGWKAAQEANDAFWKNPGRTSGAVVGSLAVSAGGFAAAAKVGGKTGAAARLAVQPGEEAASYVATRALGQTARGQRILDAIPGGRIDNEEIAMAAASKAKPATSKLVRGIRRTRYDAVRRFEAEGKRAKQFLAGERGQLELSGPSGRQTVEVDNSPGRMSPELDRADAREQDLDQTQYELRRFAQEERDAEQVLLEDAGQPTSTPTQATRADQLTVDPDELEARRLETERSFREAYSVGGRSSRGRRQLRDGSRLSGQEWPTREARQMRQQAEASSFEADTARTSRREATGAEIATGEELARQQQRQFERAQADLAQRLGLDTRGDTRQDTWQPTDVRPVQRFETGFETEAERATEFESEFERTGTEYEPVQMTTGTEVEREFERARKRFEAEFERERERQQSFGNQNPSNAFAVDMSAWENSWRTGIADIDKLWKERFGGL
ncbi:hypothetical protein NKF06_08575 [Haloferax sp. AB510]|uniref:hypothetical protein n=1 Tax=Haloferax sp. AB510 TaxID=2934172 RepID=UPI00209C23B7|nr:hypothetical protein [Haloferax sp. AB510]MCO8266638.1 hypothetical protein [Haloferax sp. AB510]